MSRTKRLVAVGIMHPRATRGDRIAHMDEDVRDVTAKLRKELTDLASKHTVTGWVLDEDSWEFGMNGRNIIGSVAIRRSDA
jgi:hypothetical protein